MSDVFEQKCLLLWRFQSVVTCWSWFGSGGSRKWTGNIGGTTTFFTIVFLHTFLNEWNQWCDHGWICTWGLMKSIHFLSNCFIFRTCMDVRGFCFWLFCVLCVPSCYLNFDSRLWPTTTSCMRLMRRCPAKTLSSASALKNPAVSPVLTLSHICMTCCFQCCFLSSYWRPHKDTCSATKGWNFSWIVPFPLYVGNK